MIPKPIVLTIPMPGDSPDACLSFVWREDRYQHALYDCEGSFRGGVRPLISSWEGTPNEAWPSSPPLQTCDVVTTSSGPQLAATGAAGTAYWSLGIRGLGSGTLLFDCACRTAAMQEGPVVPPICTTYAGQNGGIWAVHERFGARLVIPNVPYGLEVFPEVASGALARISIQDNLLLISPDKPLTSPSPSSAGRSTATILWSYRLSIWRRSA